MILREMARLALESAFGGVAQDYIEKCKKSPLVNCGEKVLVVGWCWSPPSAGSSTT